GEPLSAVGRVDVEAECPDLAEVAEHLVRDPALLLCLSRVVVLVAVLANPRIEVPDPVLLLRVGLRPREDELLVNLPEEERLRERADAFLRVLLPRDRFADTHAVRLPSSLRCAGSAQVGHSPD